MTVGAPPGWELVGDSGPAAALHRRAALSLQAGDGPLRRCVRLVEASDRCVVLGSTQDPAVLDHDRLAAAGLSWTRRRSGGSAVVVGPGEGAWVEVLVPAGDPLWRDDIGHAARWLGRCWVQALRTTGWEGVAAWDGPLVRSAWSPLICFAGLGPGEVTVGGRKVVGVSQRRTRAGALFQCAVLARWAPAELLGVMALDAATRASAVVAVEAAALGLGMAATGAAVDAFVASLPGRSEPAGRRDGRIAAEEAG